MRWLCALLFLALAAPAHAAGIDATATADGPGIELAAGASGDLPSAPAAAFPRVDAALPGGALRVEPDPSGRPAGEPQLAAAPLPGAVVPSAVAGLAGSAALAKVLAAFYSRIPRSRVLEHPTRRAIQTLVEAEPGLLLGAIPRRLGVGWGTTLHHVARLEAEGFLVSERGNGRRLFAAGALPPGERKAVVAVAHETTGRIAAYLDAHPGASQSEVCAALGIAPSVASKHVAKLRHAGLVREERVARSVRYWTAGAAAGA